MTTDELYFLMAETRCEHGRLALEDAERAGNDWTAYLRGPAHPCPFAVHDFHAYQALLPHLPAAWIVLPPRAARYGHDYAASPGALTLPDLAPILADALDPDASPWHLHAIHRTRSAPASPTDTYLIELADPATAEVRSVPTLAAYHHARRPTTTGLSAAASPGQPSNERSVYGHATPRPPRRSA